jgi:hypothetical protein
LQDFAGHADLRTTLTYIRTRDRLRQSPAYVLKYWPAIPFLEEQWMSRKILDSVSAFESSWTPFQIARKKSVSQAFHAAQTEAYSAFVDCKAASVTLSRAIAEERLRAVAHEGILYVAASDPATKGLEVLRITQEEWVTIP